MAVVAVSGLGLDARAAETDRMYLSGKGKDDGVAWDFMCSAGQNAEKWGKINVPSNWELQGYGIYSYGRDKFRSGWPKVTGHYKREFTPPASWQGKKVYLVFEGSMTDTAATLSGQSVGPMHQGGYYRFKYDVTKLLKLGQANPLEVTVDDESADPSVNQVERRGDYWNFAGIFRPVYLEAVPQQSIERVAVDGKADGSFAADVFLDGLDANAGWTVESQVMDLDGKPVGPAFSQPAAASVHLASKIESPRLWNAETPNLYQVEFRLKHAAEVVHSLRQKFGFRTLEVRDAGENSGVFVNGKRIMFQGTCRHSFWPDSGRTTSAELSRSDVLLMKEMNMNAVRCTHYPPDTHFLEACDELGLYVLDEIGGWHWKYSTPTAHRLAEEFVTHDVNHPSVLFWDNGNEGGYNPDIDDDYAKWDIQKRPVLHPGPLTQNTVFRGIDTKHYPNFSDLERRLVGPNVYFPTEMLHGLYDGGAGASLEDYWNAMRSSKYSAGGFIWAFLDEDVKRTDRNNRLDSAGNQAPDGIVGPYREREGSFYTIKELWSPIVVSKTSPNLDTFSVENRYSFTDANQCAFTWEWRKFKKPGDQAAGYDVVESGKARVDSIPPGQTGQLTGIMPNSEDKPTAHDAVSITAKDPGGHELWTWVFPTASRWDQLVQAPAPGSVDVKDAGDQLTLTAGQTGVQIDKKTGQLLFLRAGKTLPIYNGPRLVEGTGTLANLAQKTDGKDVVVTSTYTGDLESLVYRMRPNGWFTIDYTYHLTGPHQFFGLGFDYDGGVRGMRYLGKGPYRVWKNRLKGGTLNVWEKPYNDIITGYINPDDPRQSEKFDYPEFKGYYADVRWLQLETSAGPITMVLHQDDTFMQVFKPQFPPLKEQGKTGVNFPDSDIAFLNAIPAIGSKFVPAAPTGPQAQQTTATGEYRGSVSFNLGPLSQ
jgi:hypothetical protein